MMKKARVFFSLDRKIKLLFLESYFFLGWARVWKVIPFAKVALSLGDPMVETTFIQEAANRKVLSDISQALKLMSRYTFWESQCLVKAVAGMKMLERRHIESTLYLGTAKDENGTFIAHAWLRSGPFYITGSEGMENFTTVHKFAKEYVTPGGKMIG